MKKIFLFGLVFLFITGCGCRKNDKPDNKTGLNKDGVAKEEILEEEVTFSDIKLTYEGGITTLKATMKNNTDKIKNFRVKIILKDENNKEVKNLTQVVEGLEASRKQILQTGIVGDYSKIKNVEFKIEEDK